MKADVSVSDDPVLALLKDLLAIPSPPGREERMAEAVRGKLSAMGYSPETDPTGNVLVRVGGREAKAGTLMLAAHMDEIAVVVTAIEADGSLRVDRSGGLRPYKTGECVVQIVGDEGTIPGVISLGGGHAADADTRAVTWKDAKIITGYSPQRLKELGVRVGSSAVPAAAGRGPVVLGEAPDPMVAAWTFDDRAGVIALLRLLERMRGQKIIPQRPLVVAFTCHEEGGCHGAKVLRTRERPEIFVAVDGCPIQAGSQIVADHRPVAWSKDQIGNLDQSLVKSLIACGGKAGVEVQTAVLVR